MSTIIARKIYKYKFTHPNGESATIGEGATPLAAYRRICKMYKRIKKNPYPYKFKQLTCKEESIVRYEY